MNKQIITIVVGIIVLGLIIWGGYELFKPTSEDEFADLPSEDLSKEGWKTYQNEDYGWEVQHPEKYFLNDRSTPESVIFDAEGPGAGLMIEIINKKFVERMDQLGDEGWQGKGTKGFNNIVWSIRYREGTDLVPGEWHKSIRQYGHEDKVIEITLNRSTEDLFNQILSTFKFID